MTVVPTSMYFFLGDFFIWNLLGWTAPTVCQESLVDLGAEFSLPFPICSEFFRLNPWVEIMLFGPFDEGGLPALVEVTDPLAYVINHIWSILQYIYVKAASIIIGKYYMDALSLISHFNCMPTKDRYCWYSCNKITKTWIQISRQSWIGFFSNISHQRMI